MLGSNSTAIPYTCGFAADYFDAHDQNDLAKKMIKLLSNDTLLNEMKEKSKARAKEVLDYEQASKKLDSIFMNILKKSEN